MDWDSDFLHDWSPPRSVIPLTASLISSDRARLNGGGVSRLSAGFFELFVTPGISAVCTSHCMQVIKKTSEEKALWGISYAGRR